uniref:Uncharacterized protein n=1 Tax=Anopheles merus TaxID=30066 RepID=A0A182V932_ANOME
MHNNRVPGNNPASDTSGNFERIVSLIRNPFILLLRLFLLPLLLFLFHHPFPPCSVVVFFGQRLLPVPGPDIGGFCCGDSGRRYWQRPVRPYPLRRSFRWSFIATNATFLPVTTNFPLDVRVRVEGDGFEKCHNRICHLLMAAVQWWWCWRRRRHQLPAPYWKLLIGRIRRQHRFWRVPQQVLVRLRLHLQVGLELAPEVVVNQSPDAGTVAEDDGDEEEAAKGKQQHELASIVVLVAEQKRAQNAPALVSSSGSWGARAAPEPSPFTTVPPLPPPPPLPLRCWCPGAAVPLPRRPDDAAGGIVLVIENVRLMVQMFSPLRRRTPPYACRRVLDVQSRCRPVEN